MLIHSARAVIFPFFLTFLVSGCSKYQVSVNERVVYTPPPLFSDYAIEDRELKACVKASIIEQSVRSVKDMIDLSCPQGKIASLSGIEVFTYLERISIADNSVTDATPLTELKKLRWVNIKNNNLKSGAVFRSLGTLRALYLQGNAHFSCESATRLSHIEELKLPEHCQE